MNFKMHLGLDLAESDDVTLRTQNPVTLSMVSRSSNNHGGQPIFVFVSADHQTLNSFEFARILFLLSGLWQKQNSISIRCVQCEVVQAPPVKLTALS